MKTDAESVKTAGGADSITCSDPVSCAAAVNCATGVSGEAAASKAEPMSNFRWVVLFLIFVMYTVATADRANIGMAMPYIRKIYPMTNTEAGGIMSLFFLGYVIAMLPGGFLNKTFGVRNVFSFFMILTSAFTGLIGFATSIFMIKVCRLGVGLSEGPLAVGMPTTINNWFPAKEKGFATGTFIAASKFGPLIVPPLCGLFITQLGWEWVFFGFAIPGLFFSLIWYFLIPNKPADSRFVNASEADYIANDTPQPTKKDAKPKRPYKLWWLDKIIRAKKITPIDNSRKLFLSWNMMGSAFGYFFMVAITTTMMSWLPTYLTTVKKFAIMKMAFASAAPFAGAVLGNMVGGWIADNLLAKRRKPMMLVTALSTAFMMYLLINSPADPLQLGILLFLTGFLLSLGFSGFVVYPMGLATRETFPIATSITNIGGQLGGFCTPLIIGMILDKSNWDMVFTSLAAGCLLCFLIVLTLDEPVDEVAVKE